MEENKIVQLALDNLAEGIGADINGHWRELGKEVDGELEFNIEGQHIRLYAEVKKELRSHQMAQLRYLAENNEPFIVIAEKIFPKLKYELRKEKIAYLEGNGNINLKYNGLFLWIDHHKSIATSSEKQNRAFTKTGLKVIFNFLLQENLINRPYREIAETTQTGLGNVTNVFNGLKDAGFLIKLNKTQYKLTRKKELFDKWMIAYEEKLKPTIEIGTFHFLKDEDFTHWKNIKLNNMKTWWGGEPAGDLFTNYLKPGILTLYTLETKNDLIKNYRLIPDPKGNVKAYKKFWNYDETNFDIAPPMLVYADLMNTGDMRCIETAKKVYNELLRNKF